VISRGPVWSTMLPLAGIETLIYPKGTTTTKSAQRSFGLTPAV
jgi:hypothetical protein